MRLIYRSQQKTIDRTWQEKTGLPLLLLMEHAAMAVCRCCRGLVEKAKRPQTPVLVLAGRGQNGGDAFACARLLQAEGFPVRCRELEPQAKQPQEAAANRQALKQLGFSLGAISDEDFVWLQDGLIIDGIFGSGFRSERGLPEVFLTWSNAIAAARQKGATVIAIDVPSGLDSDCGLFVTGGIKADHTVTFVRPKVGLAAAPGCHYCGQVHLASIGVSDVLLDQALAAGDEPYCQLVDASLIKLWQPRRGPDSHKGQLGRLLLVAGSADMPGAAVLAASAAGRSGTGLVQVMSPAPVISDLLDICPEALLSAIAMTPAERESQLLEALTKASAVAAGPGVGRPEWLADFLLAAIDKAHALVLDADALNEIAESPQDYWPLLRQRRNQADLEPAVLTPHPGEFRRLAPDISLEDRQEAARKLARRSGCVVVLKGAATVTADPQAQIYINATGHDGLARGGSGDVLTGLIGGLLTQGLSARQAAVAGVYLHGLSAEIVAETHSRRGMLPSDLAEAFSQAYRRVGWT